MGRAERDGKRMSIERLKKIGDRLTVKGLEMSIEDAERELLVNNRFMKVVDEELDKFKN